MNAASVEGLTEKHTVDKKGHSTDNENGQSYVSIRPFLDVFPPSTTNRLFSNPTSSLLTELFEGGKGTDIIYRRGPYDELSRQSFLSLRPNERVSSFIVDVFVRRCAQGSGNNVHADLLQHWGKEGIPLSDDAKRCSTVLAPVWIENIGHFALCVADVSTHTVYYLDSLPGSQPPTKDIEVFSRKCTKVFGSPFTTTQLQSVTKTPLQFSHIPKQINATDCGIFVCMYALAICYRNGEMNFSSKDIDTARRAIAFTFIGEKIATEDIKGKDASLTNPLEEEPSTLEILQLIQKDKTITTSEEAPSKKSAEGIAEMKTTEEAAAKEAAKEKAFRSFGGVRRDGYGLRRILFGGHRCAAVCMQSERAPILTPRPETAGLRKASQPPGSSICN